jgi:uncharacterized membrane protein
MNARQCNPAELVRAYLRGVDAAAAMRQPEAVERLLDAAKREARRAWREARVRLALESCCDSECRAGHSVDCDIRRSLVMVYS